jgi:Fe-S-cluster containining protein
MTTKQEALKIGKACDNCGHCCSFGGCFVLDEDIPRIAKFLEIKEEELKRKYLDQKTLYNTKIHKTKTVPSKKPYSECIFFEDKHCLIHEVKPLHCRIGNCKEHGEELSIWFMLNYLVNEKDPQSIREWAIYLKTHPTIPGGKLEELVPDAKMLHEILYHKILK